MVVSVAVFVSAAVGSSHVGDVGFAVDREVEGERDIGRRCLAVNDDLGTSIYMYTYLHIAYLRAAFLFQFLFTKLGTTFCFPQTDRTNLLFG